MARRFERMENQRQADLAKLNSALYTAVKPSGKWLSFLCDGTYDLKLCLVAFKEPRWTMLSGDELSTKHWQFKEEWEPQLEARHKEFTTELVHPVALAALSRPPLSKDIQKLGKDEQDELSWRLTLLSGARLMAAEYHRIDTFATHEVRPAWDDVDPTRHDLLDEERWSDLLVPRSMHAQMEAMRKEAVESLTVIWKLLATQMATTGSPRAQKLVNDAAKEAAEVVTLEMAEKEPALLAEMINLPELPQDFAGFVEAAKQRRLSNDKVEKRRQVVALFKYATERLGIEVDNIEDQIETVPIEFQADPVAVVDAKDQLANLALHAPVEVGRDGDAVTVVVQPPTPTKLFPPINDECNYHLTHDMALYIGDQNPQWERQRNEREREEKEKRRRSKDAVSGSGGSFVDENIILPDACDKSKRLRQKEPSPSVAQRVRSVSAFDGVNLSPGGLLSPALAKASSEVALAGVQQHSKEAGGVRAGNGLATALSCVQQHMQATTSVPIGNDSNQAALDGLQHQREREYAERVAQESAPDDNVRGGTSRGRGKFDFSRLGVQDAMAPSTSVPFRFGAWPPQQPLQFPPAPQQLIQQQQRFATVLQQQFMPSQHPLQQQQRPFQQVQQHIFVQPYQIVVQQSNNFVRLTAPTVIPRVGALPLWYNMLSTTGKEITEYECDVLFNRLIQRLQKERVFDAEGIAYQLNISLDQVLRLGYGLGVFLLGRREYQHWMNVMVQADHVVRYYTPKQPNVPDRAYPYINTSDLGVCNPMPKQIAKDFGQYLDRVIEQEGNSGKSEDRQIIDIWQTIVKRENYPQLSIEVDQRHWDPILNLREMKPRVPFTDDEFNFWNVVRVNFLTTYVQARLWPRRAANSQAGTLSFGHVLMANKINLSSLRMNLGLLRYNALTPAQRSPPRWTGGEAPTGVTWDPNPVIATAFDSVPKASTTAAQKQANDAWWKLISLRHGIRRHHMFGALTVEPNGSVLLDKDWLKEDDRTKVWPKDWKSVPLVV